MKMRCFSAYNPPDVAGSAFYAHCTVAIVWHVERCCTGLQQLEFHKLVGGCSMRQANCGVYFLACISAVRQLVMGWLITHLYSGASLRGVKLLS